MSDTDLAFRATLDGSGFASGMMSINGQLSDLGIRTNSATASLGPLGTLMGTLANPLTAVALGITAVGAAMMASVGAAASWQSAMSGVQKTTGLSGEPLQALSSQLLDLSTTMPVASSELANIAQVAGSLGVATGEIVNFTQSAAMMAVAFEMPAEQAATMGAKILTAYQQPISSMQNLGNTVNALGDSFAATEPQILDFVNRASFLNTTFGQTIPQVAALGTVLISAGMDADLAATGIKSILNIGLQEKFSGRGITAWAELLGTTVEEAKEKIATDLNGALVETADKIAAIEDPVKRFNTAVAIAGTEGAPALLKLAGQADNLQTALQKANGEWENGSSMMKTFEANSATLNSQMDIFWNTLNKAGVELGNVLLPHITKLVVGLTDAAKAAISLGEAIYGAMSSGYEVTKVGGGLDQWLYSATGGLLGTTPEMAEMAQNAGTGTADEWVNGLTGGISDSYTEIDGTMTDTLVGAGESAGAAGGEAAGEAWAKAQDKWWKTYGAAAEAGYRWTGSEYIMNQSTTSYPSSMQASTVNLQSKVPISFTEVYGGEAMGYGSKYDLTIAGKTYSTDWSKDITRATAIPQLLKMASEDLNADISQFFGPEGEALISGAIDQVTYDAQVKVQENLTIDLSTMFKDVIVDPEKYLESQLAKIGEEAGEALKDGIVTVQEQVTLRELIDAFAAAGGSASDAMIQAILAGDWDRVAELGRQVGEAFKENLVGGMAIELPSMAELVKDPTKIMGNFEDILKFQSGYLIPALNRNMSEVKGLMEAGVDESKIYDNYIKPLKSISDYMPGWLNELMSYYESGKLDLEDFLYVYEGYLNQLSDSTKQIDRQTESVKQQTIGYNQLQKAMEDCAECAISDFGAWQEAQEGLFAESYIGAGGESYLAWKAQQVQDIAATQQAMLAAGGAVLGKSYTESPLLSYQLDLDTSNADSKLKSFQQELKGPSAMDAELKTDAAEATKATLQASIEATRPTMEVQLETSAAVAAANALYSEISALSPVVYVQVVPLISAADIAAMISAEIGGSV